MRNSQRREAKNRTRKRRKRIDIPARIDTIEEKNINIERERERERDGLGSYRECIEIQNARRRDGDRERGVAFRSLVSLSLALSLLSCLVRSPSLWE